jgi:hypothetical protein
MEKFVFLDEAENPIPNLTYSEESLCWGAALYHESIQGFTTIMAFAAICVERLTGNKEEQDRFLHSIRFIREENSGTVATREQIINAVRADHEKFTRTLRDLFHALPELRDLKQKLRQEWGDRLYSKYIEEQQNPALSSTIATHSSQALKP